MTCAVPPKSSSLSLAGAFLSEAAASIDMQVSDAVFSRLEREDICQVWQLEYIDSYQWESMGISVGLVSSIRRNLEARKAAKKPAKKRERRGELSPDMMRPRDRDLVQSGPAKSKVGTAPQVVVLKSMASRLVSDVTLPTCSETSASPSCSNDHTPSRPSTRRLQTLNVIHSPSSSKCTIPTCPLSPLQPQESVDTFFPPNMPARQTSLCPVPFLDDDDDTKKTAGNIDNPRLACWSEGSDSSVPSGDESPPVRPSRQSSVFASS